MEVKTSFREADSEVIRRYVCEFVGDRCRKFIQLYGKEVKRYKFVTDEESITVTSMTGLLYCRGGKEYAMGVCTFPGTYKVDDFCVKETVRVEYSLYGPYYPVGWSAKEIEQLLSWRAELMEKPRRIDKALVPKFEKSRWILFCFWPRGIDMLLEKELTLLDDILKEDGLVCGSMRRNLAALHGQSDIEGVKGYIRKQYTGTNMTLTPEEEEFTVYVAGFGEQVACMFNI